MFTMQKPTPGLVNIPAAPQAVKKSMFTSFVLAPLIYLFRFMAGTSGVIAGTSGAIADVLEGNASARRYAASKSSIRSCRKLRGRQIFMPLNFRHEGDAIILQKTTFFIPLLTDIRNHLLLSESTRSVYVSVAKRFFLALGAEIQKEFSEPTELDFCDFITYHWPTFVSFTTSLKEIKWGFVNKGDIEPNDVYILSSIVESAESVGSTILPLKNSKKKLTWL
jgi:hypothetical protein